MDLNEKKLTTEAGPKSVGSLIIELPTARVPFQNRNAGSSPRRTRVFGISNWPLRQRRLEEVSLGHFMKAHMDVGSP